MRVSGLGNKRRAGAVGPWVSASPAPRRLSATHLWHPPAMGILRARPIAQPRVRAEPGGIRLPPGHSQPKPPAPHQGRPQRRPFLHPPPAEAPPRPLRAAGHKILTPTPHTANHRQRRQYREREGREYRALRDATHRDSPLAPIPSPSHLPLPLLPPLPY